MHSLSFPESGWIAPCSFSRTGNFPFPPVNGTGQKPLQECMESLCVSCCGCRAFEQETSRKAVPFPPAFIFLFTCTHGSIPVVLMVISPSETGVIHVGGNALLVNKKDPVIQTDKMGR